MKRISWRVRLVGLMGVVLGVACGPVVDGRAPCEPTLPTQSEAAAGHTPMAERTPSTLRMPAACPGEPTVTAADRVELGRPGLHVELSPVVDPRSVRVRLLLEGEPAWLRTLLIDQGVPSAVHDLEGRDAQGVLALEVQPDHSGDADGGLELRTSRPVVPPLEVAYRIRAADHVEARKPAAAAVDEWRMRLPGERVLALPRALDGRVVDTRLCLRDTGLRGRGAASSFGVGHARRFRASGHELREASFLAGGMGHAIFDAAEGHDEAAWLGYFSFDPRQAAADVAAFRSAIGSVLRQKDPAPFTVLLVGDERPPGDFQITARSASLLVHVGVGQHLSGNLRLALATALVQRWLGRMLWVGPDDPGRRAHSFWFSEGVARFVARELLFRFGLISAEEYARELNRLLELLHVSPLRDRTNDELAAKMDRGALPVMVARGALYATEVDHALREVAGGNHSLLSVLPTLLARAVKERRVVATREWLAQLDEALGDRSSRGLFEQWVLQGAKQSLPRRALEPCFRATRRRYEVFSLGFDLAATRRAPNRQVAGLEPNGPAFRAGLRASDAFLTIRHRSGRTDVRAKVRVKRGEDEQTIVYRPVGGRRAGQGFAYDERIPVEQCAR